MITLLHGDHIQASRDALVSLKEKHKDKEVRQLSGKELDETKLLQALQSSSLFGGETLVVIENLFTALGGRKSKRLDGVLVLLKESGQNMDVIVWEGKEVGKTVITGLGSAVKTQLFDIPTVIFKFLDGLRPDNTAGILSLYASAVALDAPELLHTMLVRRVRELIMLSDHMVPEGMQSWQIGRLTSQAKSFTIEKLVNIYRKLYDIEVSIKSGMSPFTMKESLEIWLTEI